MSEGSKERSPQQLAKSRRDYLEQVKMLSEPVAVREFVAQPPSWRLELLSSRRRLWG